MFAAKRPMVWGISLGAIVLVAGLGYLRWDTATPALAPVVSQAKAEETFREALSRLAWGDSRPKVAVPPPEEGAGQPDPQMVALQARTHYCMQNWEKDKSCIGFGTNKPAPDAEK